jgi:hypothetical protein
VKKELESKKEVKKVDTGTEEDDLKEKTEEETETDGEKEVNI